MSLEQHTFGHRSNLRDISPETTKPPESPRSKETESLWLLQGATWFMNEFLHDELFLLPALHPNANLGSEISADYQGQPSGFLHSGPSAELQKSWRAVCQEKALHLNLVTQAMRRLQGFPSPHTPTRLQDTLCLSSEENLDNKGCCLIPPSSLTCAYFSWLQFTSCHLDFWPLVTASSLMNSTVPVSPPSHCSCSVQKFCTKVASQGPHVLGNEFVGF
ncbi:uncharacterized protein LOC127384109 isoform X2 [Apus apus]|uniref:uncharacterized protein LOC127384109 isoform X2 n=1 Tax=Apus apus TaxID=8895 RepID=UPI0021F8C356|nr:uncharacterized protein LOC127384109 isoform X2 [Apus apus]